MNSIYWKAKQKFPLPTAEDFTSETSETLLSKLTERQFATLAWIAMGKSNPMIAEIIGVSRKTVERDCTLIFERLSVEDRYGAAVEFMRYAYGQAPEDHCRK